MHASPELFDGQAGLFERRAGLPETVCCAIAKKVIEIGEANAGDLIVEVGSGTGQIGQWFEAPVRYAGFDLSAGMLKECSHRLDLIQADANVSWPLADGVARVIFSSRAVHLLQQEHVAHEVFRVASSTGAMLVLGRVEREPESVRARMAKEMNERLRRHGFAGRRGERQNRKLFVPGMALRVWVASRFQPQPEQRSCGNSKVGQKKNLVDWIRSLNPRKLTYLNLSVCRKNLSDSEQ
jgi:SAM-dependent methyltransferase